MPMEVVAEGIGERMPKTKKAAATTAHAEVPVPVELAGAMSHLRGASAGIDRLLADIDPDHPQSKALARASEAIHLALEALAECAGKSR